MKLLIIETAKVSPSTTIAHVRNAMEIHRYFNSIDDCSCDIVDGTSDVPDGQFDIILFSAATIHFNFAQFEALLDRQTHCQIGWITNEFELFANAFVKERMTFMITNFEEHGIKKAHRHDSLLVTNLNTLLAKERNNPIAKKYGCCYYGTYRKYRDPYFSKYLDESGEVLLSTSRKNVKRFIDAGVSCNFTDKFSWSFGQETLNLFASSLYIEDTKTHSCFNYMANRFFEGLFCNTPCFFDSSCISTIHKDVYEIDKDFIVDGLDDLKVKTSSLSEEKKEQFLTVNTGIALNEKRKTLRDIHLFFKGII